MRDDDKFACTQLARVVISQSLDDAKMGDRLIGHFDF